MMRKLYVILTFVFVSGSLYSQKLDLFPQKHGERKYGAFFSMAGQNSLYKGALFSILGVRTGLTINGVHKIGLGYNFIALPMRYSGDLCCGVPALGETHELRYSSFTLFYSRTLYKSRIWEWTLPSFLDLGKGTLIHHTSNGQIESLTPRIFTVRLEVQNRIFIMPWVALKWAVGYRVAITNNPLWHKTLDTPYLNWGLSMDLRKLWFVLKGEENWLWKKEGVVE